MIRIRMIPSLVVLCTIAFCDVDARVVISEVMYDPAGSEFTDEYVELWNTGSEPVDLSGWRIGDGDGTDDLVPHAGGLVLGPGGFALVLDSGYFDGSRPYDPIPDGVLVLTVSAATLGRSGFSNASPETIVLVDAAGQIASEVRYAVDGREGYSYERVDPNGGDDASNFGHARWEGGTPGRTNSRSPKARDVALTLQDVSPVSVPFGAKRGVTLTVTNGGAEEVGEGRIEIAWGDGDDARLLSFGSIGVGAEEKIVFPLPEGAPGRRVFEARVSVEGDEDFTNDTAGWTAVYGSAPGSVAMTELMFAPDAGGEWIEVLNTTSQALNLSGWRVRDRSGTTGTLVEDATIPPGERLVLAEDVISLQNVFGKGYTAVSLDRWPSLNDSGDDVALLDATHTEIERLTYDRTPNGGRSLERVDSEADAGDPGNWLWSTAEAGATPGKANSVAFVASEAVTLTVDPNPFRDRTTISIGVPERKATLSVRIFDDTGRPVRTLLSGEMSGSRRDVVWRGDDGGGRPVRPGVYIVLLEATLEGGKTLRRKATVVSARGL